MRLPLDAFALDLTGVPQIFSLFSYHNVPPKLAKFIQSPFVQIRVPCDFRPSFIYKKILSPPFLRTLPLESRFPFFSLYLQLAGSHRKVDRSSF